MSKKSKKLLKEFWIFILFMIIGYLTDKLPNTTWSLIIQLIVTGITLILAIKLLKSTTRKSDSE